LKLGCSYLKFSRYCIIAAELLSNNNTATSGVLCYSYVTTIYDPKGGLTDNGIDIDCSNKIRLNKKSKASSHNGDNFKVMSKIA
jgi:hypothetical protein